jgi:2-oxoglutarate ferredoxin oxidoreductase subunit alpha
MTPVFLLSEGFTNFTMEPWRIPEIEELPEIETSRDWLNQYEMPDGFLPYKRKDRTLARPWAIPGEIEGIHRIGGLEKKIDTGEISYFPENHEEMCRIRAEKIARIADDIPPIEIDGDEHGDLLLIGWGGTEGVIREATRMARSEGKRVSRIHLYHINPLPKDLPEVVSRFKNVLIPENNSGQLRSILRDKLLVDIKGLNRLTGELLRVTEVYEGINKVLAGE